MQFYHIFVNNVLLYYQAKEVESLIKLLRKDTNKVTFVTFYKTMSYINQLKAKREITEKLSYNYIEDFKYLIC